MVVAPWSVGQWLPCSYQLVPRTPSEGRVVPCIGKHAPTYSPLVAPMVLQVSHSGATLTSVA